ncbi:nuclear egress lamina protein [Bovine alphaherpesvirus 2]|uniref:Nuclear egress lamina protein n=1 Tax=Bovine alphaherpesvirus 2 TaxID=10295 RepID=A0A7T1L7J0_9ALPH|nr:nuclear egress lamina protein [Bovine alphaherpesvirus 2]
MYSSASECDERRSRERPSGRRLRRSSHYLGVRAVAGRRSSRSRVAKTALVSRERERYRGIFAALAHTPSEEIAIVRSMAVPLVKTSPVALPFDLDQTVADNCLTLSGMGYYMGIGSCCPACNAGDGRVAPLSREAMILAFVQQINTIFEHRAFLASLVVLSERRGEPAQDLLATALSQPELFFAHTILRGGGSVEPPRLLFYPDPVYGGYMLYAVFPGKSMHLHYRTIDHMLTTCPGYRFVAHVWQTMFLLVVRRGTERPADSDVPSVSAEDIYCKMRDISFDGGLMLEYRRLYAAFDEFLPP